MRQCVFNILRKMRILDLTYIHYLLSRQKFKSRHMKHSRHLHLQLFVSRHILTFRHLIQKISNSINTVKIQYQDEGLSQFVVLLFSYVMGASCEAIVTTLSLSRLFVLGFRNIYVGVRRTSNYTLCEVPLYFDPFYLVICVQSLATLRQGEGQVFFPNYSMIN